MQSGAPLPLCWLPQNLCPSNPDSKSTPGSPPSPGHCRLHHLCTHAVTSLDGQLIIIRIISPVKSYIHESRQLSRTCFHKQKPSGHLAHQTGCRGTGLESPSPSHHILENQLSLLGLSVLGYVPFLGIA